MKKNTLVLLAHLDHPGFEIIKIEGETIYLKSLGNTPKVGIIGNSIKIYNREGFITRGLINNKDINTGILIATLLDGKIKDINKRYFAVFDFDDFTIKDNIIYARAHDDLAGCAIELALLKEISRSDFDIQLYLIFHRAEEMGFLGAYYSATKNKFPKNSLFISIEASKELVNAKLNNGAVIRQGDRKFIFDKKAENIMIQAKKELEKENIKIQIARMTGGTCEASVYFSQGYCTTGLALPLLNYHNRGKVKPLPEGIGVYDINSAVVFLHKLSRILAIKDLSNEFKFNEKRNNDFLKKVESNFNQNLKDLIDLK